MWITVEKEEYRQGARCMDGNNADGTNEAAFTNPEFPNLLTRREIEILHWMATGKSNVETASLLHISANTVRYHLRAQPKKS